MNKPIIDQVEQLLETIVDTMAQEQRTQDLCMAVVMSYTLGDEHMVNYINTHYSHMFSAEQQTALAELSESIGARAAKIRAVSERDPLSEYLETLNSTQQ